MKYFQIVWGYVILLSADKLISELIKFIFGYHSTLSLSLIIFISLLLFRIYPLEKSNYPFGFHIELQSLNPHLKV